MSVTMTVTMTARSSSLMSPILCNPIRCRMLYYESVDDQIVAIELAVKAIHILFCF